MTEMAHLVSRHPILVSSKQEQGTTMVALILTAALGLIFGYMVASTRRARAEKRSLNPSPPTPPPPPIMHDGTQSTVMLQSEMAMESMLSRKRHYRRDMKRIASNPHGFMSYLLDRPNIAKTLDGLPRPTLRIVGRHTVQGALVAGSMQGTKLTIGRDYLTPATMLHELAHYAIERNRPFITGHTAEWEKTYRDFVNEVYA